jgi:hypothetical protein
MDDHLKYSEYPVYPGCNFFHFMAKLFLKLTEHLNFRQFRHFRHFRHLSENPGSYLKVGW